MKLISIVIQQAPAPIIVPSPNRAMPTAGCEFIAHPVRLEKFGDNNLSVHPTPYHPSASTEIDELVPGDFVCVLPGAVGPWLHVQYTRAGRVRTGWSHGGYLSD